MRLTRYESPRHWLQRAQIPLEREEAKNSLLIGVIVRLAEQPDRIKTPPYLATVDDGDTLIAAAAMTPPHRVIISSTLGADPAPIRLILADLSDGGWTVPGVIAESSTAAATAHLWTEMSGRTHQPAMSQRIYELRQVNAPANISGRLRAAIEEDASLAAEWVYQFMLDAHLPADQQEARSIAELRIADRDLFLWEVDGRPVSMAARSRHSSHGITVSLVYTPPLLRRRGYASACVAALSQRLLDAGWEFCALYTDLANPTSNAIYQQIGYRPICDSNEYDFATSGKETPMTTAILPAHSEIEQRFTWNDTSVFASPGAWDVEANAYAESVGALSQYQGRIKEGPAVLADALDDVQALQMRVGKLYTYAGMAYAVNTTDANAAKRNSRAQALYGQTLAAASFLDPELLDIGRAMLERWMAEEPRLAYFKQYVDNLFRRQAHVRSAEVEELLGMLTDPFGNISMTQSMLADADLKFPQAKGVDGQEYAVSQGNLPGILANPDREARRTAWEGYRDVHLAFKNTLASNLMTSVKANVFQMRARRYNSTLEMALDEWNLPTTVFHNLIEVFKKNLPTWHKYWQVRRKALGVDTLHEWDIWAPLSQDRPKVPYERGVQLILEGLAPMGAAYVETVRRGCAEERWVDVYPCEGKMGGAFSSGWKGTHPFIMMSYTDEVFSMSTLAHELGHSMHSYLTWQNQPEVYSGYGMFVAETASNFHQAMVRAHLLETTKDPAFLLAILEEAMSNFHRYFFIMPTLARFELEVHQREERGEGMSADDMIELMADLFSEGYGGHVAVDRQRTGITWATFSHLYVDYYVFQYATGISAANALARGIRAGKSGAVDQYLRFLKAGNSLYAVDALKVAGVDMTTPAPVEAAFEVLGGLVDRLAKLVG